MTSLYEKITDHGIEIHSDEPLKNHTTFKIGGKAKYFVVPKNEDEIVTLLDLAKAHNVRAIPIGNGSNMLVTDEDIDAMFIYIGEKMSGITLVDENTVCCGAGALLTRVCRFALENSLTGMEAAFGIPGSVGGGLYMNAGAYGTEMKDYVLKAEYIASDLTKREISKDEMNLSYRKSVFSDNCGVITKVYFTLEKGDKSEIKSKMDDFMGRRKSKQPLEYPSAGSVFKRPEGYFAGALIEECNLKGASVGGAQVSEKHAGFIINKGGATCKDVTDLIALCQKTVYEQKGVRLEPEIKVLK